MANDPYFPYKKLQNYSTMPNADTLLKKIVDYILDLPMKGYEPEDNNTLPRVRIIKTLYHDVPRPLLQPLPTPTQKTSIVYNPLSPDVPPTDKGYRIYPMIYPIEAQAEGQTTLKIFMGWTKATSPYRIDQGIAFEVLSKTFYEGNSGGTSLSRTFQICTDIIEALNGVNMDGVGTFYFDRRQHSECGIEPIADKSQNVGYRLMMGLTYMGSENPNSLSC